MRGPGILIVMPCTPPFVPTLPHRAFFRPTAWARGRGRKAARGIALALSWAWAGACNRQPLLPTAQAATGAQVARSVRAGDGSTPVMAAAEPGSVFSRAELMDPATCGSCHAQAMAEWAQSPHAAAADDPVFLAMNRMAQRETRGAIGNFCVQCHAPLAVREKATTDGLNLAQVPRALKGVTCYFCHDVDSVAGNHNNPLHLAQDATMRGPIKDAVVNAAHASAYGALHDRRTLASSSLCGSCHDIVTPPGAQLESTYAEWQASVYAHNVTGQSCSGCHMPESATPTHISDDPNAPLRYRHAHSFPGLDLPLPPGHADGVPAVQQDLAQASQSLSHLLDKTLQTALCVRQVGPTASLRVVLDNVGAGHAFTSGAVQDRRLWIEIVAYKDGKVIYESGRVPEGEAVMQHLDPDIWLMRSCLFDKDGAPTSHFWQAASVDANPLPTISTFNVNDPNFYRSNVVRAYPPSPGASLAQMPDKVTMRILVEPIGLDLLDELVAAGDLDASVRKAAKRIVVGPTQTLVWTPGAINTGYQEHGLPVQCVTASNINLKGLLTPAPSHRRCKL